MSKLEIFIDGKQYADDKLNEFTIKQQSMANNTTVSYDVVASDGSATIIDYDGSIAEAINEFNNDEIQGLDPTNVPISIVAGENIIADAISNDADYTVSEKTMSVQITDIVSKLENIEFDGIDFEKNVTIAYLFNLTQEKLGIEIDLTGDSGFVHNGNKLNFSTYFDSLILSNCYLPKSTARDVLRKFCQVGQMSLVYTNTVNGIHKFKAISNRLSSFNVERLIVLDDSVLTQEFDKTILLKNKYNRVSLNDCEIGATTKTEEISQKIDVTTLNHFSGHKEEHSAYTRAEVQFDLDIVATNGYESDGIANTIVLRIPRKSNYNLSTWKSLSDTFSYNLTYNRKKYVYNYVKDQASMTQAEIDWFSQKTLLNIEDSEWEEVDTLQNQFLVSGTISNEYNHITEENNKFTSQFTAQSNFNNEKSTASVSFSFAKPSVVSNYEYFFIRLATPYAFNNKVFAKTIDYYYDNQSGLQKRRGNIHAENIVSTPKELTIVISGETYTIDFNFNNTTYAINSNNDNINEIKLDQQNELLQKNVIFFDKVVDIPQTVAYNIIEDYRNGRSTATAHIVCADLYDTDGFLAKDFERKGEILDLGDIVYVQEDDTKWLVTGREVHYDGTPTMDVELVQVGKIINTDISQDPTLREGDYLQFPYVNEYWNSTYAPKGVADTEYATISWDYETNSSAYATVEYKYVFDRNGNNLIETMPISPSKLTYNVGKILSFDDNLFKVYSPILAVPETKVTASTKVDLFWSLVENKKLVEVDFENGSKISAVNTSSPIVVGDETYLNDEFSIYYKESVEKVLLSEMTYGETLGNIKLVPNFTAIGAGATGYLSFVTNGTVVEFGSQTGVANFYMSFGATDIVYSSTIMGAVEKLTYYCYVSGFVDGKDNEISFSPYETWYDSRIPLDSFRISNYQPTETYEQSREDTYGSYKYTLTGNDLKIEINIYQGILKDLMTDPMIQVVVSPIETFVRLYDNDNSPRYYSEGEIIEIANAERGDFSFNTTSTFYPTLDSCFEFYKTTTAKLPTSGAKIVYDSGIEVVCSSGNGTPTLVFADTNTSSTFGDYTFNQTLNTEQIFLATRDFGKVVSVEGNWGDFKLYKKQIYLYDNLTGATTYFNQKQTNFLLGFTSKIIKTRKVDLALMGVETDQSFQQGETLYIDRSQIVTEGSYDQVIFTNGNSLGLCYATEDNTIGGSPGQGLWWYDGTSTPYDIIIFKGKGFETVSLPNAQNGWGNILSANKNTGIYVSSNLVEDIEVSGGFSLSKSDKITPDYKGWFTIKKSY